ncbi:hypothetical protein ACHQM5_011586 [Ranunculus cassubicifolius]
MNSSSNNKRRSGIRLRLSKVIKCFGVHHEQLSTTGGGGGGEIIPPYEEESLVVVNGRDYSSSRLSSSRGGSSSRVSSRVGGSERWMNDDAESMNIEVAKAMVGSLEYYKGNIDTALHILEGIDVAAVTPKIRFCISSTINRHKRRFKRDAIPVMPINDASLLVEAIYLKAKSLQTLGRHKEAAESCKVILDVFESALPEGVPSNFSTNHKLQEILTKSVKLLPELWKLADFPQDSILSYRRALLHQWNLDAKTIAKIQKEFSIFLLYGGTDATLPDGNTHNEGSFIPRNNTEEAILLLMILLKKSSLKIIDWDPSILDHLSFALSVSGGLRELAFQIESLVPGALGRDERYYTLGLCYHGFGEDSVALNLLRRLLRNIDKTNDTKALLMAANICRENPNLEYTQEGVEYAHRALSNVHNGCEQLTTSANCLLGSSLLSQGEGSQYEALQAFEAAEKTKYIEDFNALYHLALGNAELRNLDTAVYYAKKLLNLESGSNLEGWILYARILSAQKRFADAENVIGDALNHTSKWNQGGLLRTKAKLQIAQGDLKNAVETYSRILAIIRVNENKSLEVDTWHCLASVYMKMSRWSDAEDCLSRSESISPHRAATWHLKGLLYEAKGLDKEALIAFRTALDIDSCYVPSLVSAALNLKKSGNFQSVAIARGFLTEAVKLDKTNYSAWHSLGLIYKEEGGTWVEEAAECFANAASLEESQPVEPFR